MIHDTIVIGSGLFGSLITRGLRSIGQNVLLVNAYKPEAGSPPAACLINPSWSKKIETPKVDAAMTWLQKRFIIHNLPFRETTQSGKQKETRSWFIEPKDMLLEPDVDARVTVLTKDPGTGNHVVLGGTPQTEFVARARQVVVAAGVWSQKLLPNNDLAITGKAGCAFLYPEWVGPGFNFMSYWAPYKQIVGFQRGDGFWVNDGSAIKSENWTAGHTLASLERCEAELWNRHRELSGKAPRAKVLYGIRPYTKAKPCLCEEVAPGLWVAVGAAKNGTLLGGYCAQLIQERSQ
jgi:glycine/D-amino acid oxidase-like deaminating enzyme